MSNFVSKERERVKQMIALIGAKYTGYMTRANSLLISKQYVPTLFLSASLNIVYVFHVLMFCL